MLVIRATQKLLAKLGAPATYPPSSTTTLGDWYAKPFGVAQRRFVLLISEKSRLAVLMPGRDVSALPRNFPGALEVQLERLGVPQDAIDREVAACGDYVVAATASKSLLGTLNDYAYMAQHRLRDQPHVDLEDESFSLSHTPLSPLGFQYAADVALGLFGIESHRGRMPF